MKGSLASRLNLARRPFTNQRSLWRVVGVLWAMAVGLMLVNGVLFWSYRSGDADARAELRQLRDSSVDEVAQLRQLRGELEVFDLAAQNEQVAFLNTKIEERTFPWSRLFDELVEAMPSEIRLLSLAPKVKERNTRRRRSRRQDDDNEEGRWMLLSIEAEAANGEAALIFLEQLFTHKAFIEPSLLDEVKHEGQRVLFSLEAKYRLDRQVVAEEEREAQLPTATTVREPGAQSSDEPEIASAVASDPIAEPAEESAPFADEPTEPSP